MYIYHQILSDVQLSNQITMNFYKDVIYIIKSSIEYQQP